MKIIQARIRGLGTLEESRWFELSSRLNLFHFSDYTYGKYFSRILQTINPTYACHSVEPFADFPKLITQNGHTRRVNPTKKTVVMSVFGATPTLVNELAAVSELLYETDRIEVGRRLDYSQWINFVELASSTRWSEISGDIKTLQDHAHRLEPDLVKPLDDILKTLKPTDRVKDTLQDTLTEWLQNLPPALHQSSEQLIESTLTAVKRAGHFLIARDIVRSRLPLFVVLDNSDPASLQIFLQLIFNKSKEKAPGSDSCPFLDELNNQLTELQYADITLRVERSPEDVSLFIDGKPAQLTTEEPLPSLRLLQAKTCLAVAFSRVVNRAEPILLFANPEHTLPKELHVELADFVMNISKTCQSLCSFSAIDIFPQDIPGRRYSKADINMTGEQKGTSPLMPVDGQM
ncbi:MAG: hypothetical protein WBB19_01510 [Desulforhopalus sp.]